MKRTLLPVPPALLLITAMATAYHVGEKPRDQSPPARDAPVVIRFTPGYLEFSTTNDSPVTISIVDVLGRYVPISGGISITEYPRGGYGSARIAIENLSSGPYFLTLTNSAGTTAHGFAGVR